MDSIRIPGLPNARNPAPLVASGGQPTPGQLQAAVASGIRRVVNLRPPSEDAGFDEQAEAMRLGLAYAVVPIAGAGDLNRANVAKFDALLNADPGTPVLVHCRSGGRVGAMAALRAGWLQGKAPPDAIEVGRRWGLSPNLEVVVLQLLE